MSSPVASIPVRGLNAITRTPWFLVWGMLGHFVVAGSDDLPGIVYLDTAAARQIVETPSVVDQVGLTWEALRSEARPRAASRDLIAKIAEDRWT